MYLNCNFKVEKHQESFNGTNCFHLIYTRTKQCTPWHRQIIHIFEVSEKRDMKSQLASLDYTLVSRMKEKVCYLQKCKKDMLLTHHNISASPKPQLQLIYSIPCLRFKIFCAKIKLKGEDIYPSYQTPDYDFSTCRHNLFRLFHMKKENRIFFRLQKDSNIILQII